MRGTSRASLAAAEEDFEPVLATAGEDGATLGAELFALVDALDGSGSLRRTLTDPSLEAEAKTGLVGRLLAAADPRTVAVAQDLVARRWSAEGDLADATEQVAFHAVLASAEVPDGLSQVEDDLFRLTRALAGQREVRRVLGDPTVAPDARAGLVEAILGGRAHPVTLRLARRAAAAPRGRRYVATLVRLTDLVAFRRRRDVATVTTAAPLSAAQTDRLADLLARGYGRPVQVNVVVEPGILGGLRVQMGAHVLDATMLARLADARRRLAS